MKIDKFPFETRFKVSQSNNTSIGYTHVLCCPCCMFFTLSFANLHKHALTHDDSQLSSYRTYTCSKCFSTSTEKCLMLEHVNIYHRNTKKPVELTEEIHTILRKTESPEQHKPQPDLNLTSPITKTPMTMRKIGVKRRMIPQPVKRYSTINQRLKLKSQMNRYSKYKLKKSEKESLETQGEDRQVLVTKEEDRLDNLATNENEPIDMTIKPDIKHSKDLSTEKSLDESDTRFGPDYSANYPNGRSYLYDVLSKNPLPPGLSQSFLLRYFSAQIQSLQAAKYFANSNFIFPPQLLSHQDSNYQQRIFENQPPSSVPKASENSSISQRNLHRNNFSPFQNHILLEWYDNHKHKPYPSTEETKHLATLCGLSYPQVKKWFANKRARSSFYQKDDLISCQSQARYNLLRFPLQISNRLNSEVVKSLEAQFANSMDNLAMVSTSSQEDSLVSA